MGSDDDDALPSEIDAGRHLLECGSAHVLIVDGRDSALQTVDTLVSATGIVRTEARPLAVAPPRQLADARGGGAGRPGADWRWSMRCASPAASLPQRSRPAFRPAWGRAFPIVSPCCAGSARMTELRGLYLVTPDWTDTRRLLNAVAPLLDAGVALLRNTATNSPMPSCACRRRLHWPIVAAAPGYP